MVFSCVFVHAITMSFVFINEMLQHSLVIIPTNHPVLLPGFKELRRHGQIVRVGMSQFILRKTHIPML